MLRDLRLSKAMSQASLAREAGICASHLCQIEGGSRRPSISVLARLCDALDATPAERSALLASLMAAPSAGQAVPASHDAASAA
jgi:transcriptional regulator with XRE-family HTH domain